MSQVKQDAPRARRKQQPAELQAVKQPGSRTEGWLQRSLRQRHWRAERRPQPPEVALALAAQEVQVHGTRWRGLPLELQQPTKARDRQRILPEPQDQLERRPTVPRKQL